MRSEQASRIEYDAWHTKHEVDVESNTPWHTMLKAKLDPQRDLANRRILDIGCGRGGFAVWLAQQPATPKEVVGCDFSPAAVSKAREYALASALSGIRWEVADIQSLAQFADGEFDTVSSTETIEHVPDPPLAVRQLARVLKPGGRLFLTTPNYFGLSGLYRAYCVARGRTFDEGGQPICQWTMLHRTKRWIRRAGLRIIHSDSKGIYLPVPGRQSGLHLPWLEQPKWLMKRFGVHSLVIAEKPIRLGS